MRRLLIMVVLLVSGCSHAHKLDSQYRPLEQIRESVMRPGTGITTLGKSCYVRDLDEWLEKHPPGSPLFHAIMLHEQLHAQRQLDMGLTKWLGRYLTDLSFMRDEELRGWYLQIQEYRRRGLQVSPEGVAKALSDYQSFAGRMMSYEDALTWIRDVLAGRWQPAKED